MPTAMNAVSVYVSTAKLVLQATDATSTNTSTQNDLSRLLPHLHQLLSCVVCCRLLNDPFGPRDGHCQHNVCRLCVRGQKLLHPSCNDCKDFRDFKSYSENSQMRCLLLCYKSLCEHLITMPLFTQLGSKKPVQLSVLNSSPSIVLPSMSLQELILEGARYDDIINCFNNDLPKQHILVSKPQLSVASTTVLSSTSSTTPSAPTHASPTSTFIHSAPAKVPTPPLNTTIPLVASPLRKQETVSPPLPAAANVQSIATSHAQVLNLNQLKSALPNNGTITYIGPKARGVVVPIVSSSATTTAPLSIASAKLQSLNRQLAQARQALAVSSSTATPYSSTPNSDVGRHLGVFKASLAPTTSVRSTPASTPSTAPTTSTMTPQLRNPPSIKTVSNGSAMYSVLYTGIGNKITIKRKTDGDEDTAQRKNASTSAPPPTLLRQVSKANAKRRGCRCGNATPTPGKLTCCGQRCPCYVDSKSCVGCKCRGCRNPHRPDGGKVRPIIPELACYEIQMADDHSDLSPHELPIATTASSSERNSSPAIQQQTMVQQSYQLDEHVQRSVAPCSSSSVPTVGHNSAMMPQISLNSSTSSSTGAALIPLHSFQQMAVTTTVSQSQQQQQQQQQQRQCQTLGIATQASVLQPTSATNILQLEQLPRESVLIQNAEGKYQVVNLFTASGTHNQSATQMPNLQRIHSLPQPPGNSCNSHVLLPPTAAISNVCATATTTTHTLPQIIIQPQHQQHQHQQHHTHNQATQQQRLVATSTTAIPLQLQQHLKQNVITVHPIISSSSPSPTQSHNLSSVPTSATTSTAITLSPIVVSSPNTSFPTAAANSTINVFADSSSNEFINVNNKNNNNNGTSTNAMCITSSGRTVHLTSEPPIRIKSNLATAVPPPALIEVVHSKEL